MKMSIEKSKQLLSDYQKLFNNLNGDYKLSQVQASELSHSIGIALDIIRKYQKMERMIDMTEGEAEYLKYKFKQYLGSVSRAIQNKRLKEQEMGMTSNSLCDSCTNIWCKFQSGIVRTKCTFYTPPTTEATPKAEYEARLKANMAVILEKLKEEFENLDPNYECNTYYDAIRDCINLTEQEIDALKKNKGNDVKPIEATPQLSEVDSKKIIKEANTKPNYKRVQKLRESRPVESL